MSNTSTKRKETVNTKHCCICLKLRNIILFTIILSLLLIISYGYPYWINPSLRQSDPTNYYIYISIAAISFITCIIFFIAVYYHIRSIIKYSFYWIIIHIIIITITYWLLNTFNFLHFAFYIAWIILQIILIYLLIKYKSLLKLVYDWDDNENETHTNQHDNSDEKHQINNSHKITSNSPNNNISKIKTSRANSNSTNVNVSINLTPSHVHPQTSLIYPQSYSQINTSHIPNNSISFPANNITYNNHTIPPIQNNNNEKDKEVIIKINSNSHNKKAKHYHSLPTEDMELSDHHIEYKEKDDYDSDSLYNQSVPTRHTTGTGTGDAYGTGDINRVDTLDLLVATSDPLPEEQFEKQISIIDNALDIVMDNETEGIDSEFEQWIVQTLEQCAPLNNEWKQYWNNFKVNNVTRDTLMSLNNDKQRNEWKQLIPKMGPRIQFQQSFEHYMVHRRESHLYPTPKSVRAVTT
eukprot:262480_1